MLIEPIDLLEEPLPPTIFEQFALTPASTKASSLMPFESAM